MIYVGRSGPRWICLAHGPSIAIRLMFLRECKLARSGFIAKELHGMRSIVHGHKIKSTIVVPIKGANTAGFALRRKKDRRVECSVAVAAQNNYFSKCGARGERDISEAIAIQVAGFGPIGLHSNIYCAAHFKSAAGIS